MELREKELQAEKEKEQKAEEEKEERRQLIELLMTNADGKEEDWEMEQAEWDTEVEKKIRIWKRRRRIKGT